MSLTHYERKRDFKKTTEPSGSQKKKRRARELTFVIQEHHARNLHYDFRLEWNGVLKSWAVPKGPSQDPHVKRLAVEVEDHPLEYGKFEGTIPEHQYGAGEVYIWDHGTWHPHIDVAAGLKKGHLSFELKGKKLRGTWDLIRTGIPGRNRQWLLIKKTDSYSLDTPKETKKRPTKSKLTFVAPELAQLHEEPPNGSGWIHEIKYDGYRIQAHLHSGKVHLFTRSGQDWTSKFPHLEQNLQHLKTDSAIIDGELVALDKDGVSNFQLLQNTIKSDHTASLYYYAFDLLHLDGKDLRNLPLSERKKKLKDVLKKSTQHVRYSQDFIGSGAKLLKMAREHHLEGIISKRQDSQYHSGRNPNWIKVKCKNEQEFVIGGYTEGSGGRSSLGALLLGVYKNKKLHYAGKVGTGFTQKSLQEILKALTPLKQKESPFDANQPRLSHAHWVKPRFAAQITFANWTDDGLLRVPVFHGLREDKSPRKIGKDVLVMKAETKTLSNPDKILYRSEKITKKDVANYYTQVADRMIPLISDRPLSLLRCPQGTASKCFFQKHPSPITPAMTPVEISERNGIKTYVSIHNEIGLMDLVQMNAFEIHCSNARRENFELPDQIVMDLDPGPRVTWKKVVAAAIELKELLEQLHLKSFVKLSGSKGLHVHIPIEPIYSWDQIVSFSQVIAQHLESERPDFYVSKMTKSLRQGKIFIDYFRNARNATAVAPYSLRAHLHSSVALPITWRQLLQTRSSDQYTLPKAITAIRKQRQDPWKGYTSLQQRISLLEKKSGATPVSPSL